jgi:hypothetical protein
MRTFTGDMALYDTKNAIDIALSVHHKNTNIRPKDLFSRGTPSRAKSWHHKP